MIGAVLAPVAVGAEIRERGRKPLTTVGAFLSRCATKNARERRGDEQRRTPPRAARGHPSSTSAALGTSIARSPSPRACVEREAHRRRGGRPPAPAARPARTSSRPVQHALLLLRRTTRRRGTRSPGRPVMNAAKRSGPRASTSSNGAVGPVAAVGLREARVRSIGSQPDRRADDLGRLARARQRRAPQRRPLALRRLARPARAPARGRGRRAAPAVALEAALGVVGRLAVAGQPDHSSPIGVRAQPQPQRLEREHVVGRDVAEVDLAPEAAQEPHLLLLARRLEQQLVDVDRVGDLVDQAHAHLAVGAVDAGACRSRAPRRSPSTRRPRARSRSARPSGTGP